MHQCERLTLSLVAQTGLKVKVKLPPLEAVGRVLIYTDHLSALSRPDDNGSLGEFSYPEPLETSHHQRVVGQKLA